MSMIYCLHFKNPISLATTATNNRMSPLRKDLMVTIYSYDKKADGKEQEERKEAKDVKGH